jgi:hypothetical protein
MFAIAIREGVNTMNTTPFSVADIINIVLAVIAFLSLTITFLSLIFFARQTRLLKEQTELLRTQLHDEFEWRRREKAASYSQIYIQSIHETKKSLHDAFGPLTDRTPITVSEIDNLAGTKEHKFIKEDINYLLSHLENVGLTVRYGINDIEIVDNLMGGAYIRYFKLFELYIEEGKKRQESLWENTIALARDLEDRRASKLQGRPPLGVTNKPSKHP